MNIRSVFNTTALTCCLLIANALGYVPNYIDFQGTLTDSAGNPITGTRQMNFAIYSDSAGGLPVWNEMQSAVDIVDGLFHVKLGSENPIPASIFDGEQYWLGITVIPDVDELSPRQPLVSVPYGFRSNEANHAVYSDTSDYSRVGSPDDDWMISGSNIYRNTGYVGIGTTNPQNLLQVGVGDESTIRIGYNPQMTLSRDVANSKFKIQLTGSNYLGKVLQLGRDDQNHNIALMGNVGIGNTNPTENLVVGDNLGSFSGNRIVVGDSSAGAYTGIVMGENSNNRGWALWDTDNDFLEISTRNAGTNYGTLYLQSGKVGIGTSSPLEKLHVAGEAYASSDVSFDGTIRGVNTGLGYGVKGENSGNGNWGYVGGTTYSVYGQNAGSGCYGGFGTTFYGAVAYGSTGNLGRIGTDSVGVYGVTLDSRGSGVMGRYNWTGPYGLLGTPTVGVLGRSSVEDGYGGYFWASGTDGFGVFARGQIGVYGLSSLTNGYGGYFYASASGGTGIYARGSSIARAAIFRGNVEIQSNLTGDMVLELGEGLDYAEGFNLSEETTIESGTVLIIDPEKPGKLAVSTSAYDTKVAGIVAGANGLGSGVKLGSDDSDSNVALAGRVYCNVDASTSGIQPGDLLTTSDVPGYAMKATDYQHAQSAILGKAMEPLEKGRRGQILVLVTLQ